MSWPTWGKSWGKSWGGSWGYKEQVLSGGGPSANASAGWARERYLHEQGLIERQKLREAQAALRKTEEPAAVEMARAINRYEVGAIEIDELRVKNAILTQRLKNNTELRQELEIAQAAIDVYLIDEQESIDVLMADFDADLQIIGVLHG